MVVTLTFDIGSLLDSDPSYYEGRPFIRGKRVTVQRVGILHSEGLSAAEIADEVGATMAEVHAALSYYLANREDIDADVKAQDQQYHRAAAQHGSLRSPK